MHSVSNHKFNTCLFTLGKKRQKTNTSQAHLTKKPQSDLYTYAYSFSPAYTINKNLCWLELRTNYSLHRKGALLCDNVLLGGRFCNAEEKNLLINSPPELRDKAALLLHFHFNPTVHRQKIQALSPLQLAHCEDPAPSQWCPTLIKTHLSLQLVSNIGSY